MPDTISCEQFTNFLDAQEPIYDKLIIRDIRPEDSWIGHVETAPWDAYDGVEHTFDRFRSVFPNVTKPWQAVSKDSCIGAPCDPPETEIGWGYDRTTYGLERQSFKTKLLCFDQIIHVNKAKEHFAQIVGDILRPTTGYVSSHYLRKRAVNLAGKKWLANATMSDFTFAWSNDADGNEVILTTSANPTSKLTPQMLQRRVQPLMSLGYFGKNPFKDQPPMIELVTDVNTLWDLDKAASDSAINQLWRFQQWDAANKYYKYSFSGQIGNYVTRADPFVLRFNKTGANTYQLILPYTNEAAFSGIGSDYNTAFDLAQYQFSIIWHRRAMVWKTQNMEAVNSEMPFAVRSLGGKWNWAMDNLGADDNGCVIDNKRRNKGLFYADFEFASKPQYVEFAEAIFHLREPACITIAPLCNDDPGYPTQDYDSANADCPPATLCFDIVDQDAYQVNGVTCNGVPIVIAASGSLADLDAVVTWLNANVASLGTWSHAVDSTEICLDDSTCTNVTLDVGVFVP